MMFVYIIGGEEGCPVKIGVTNNLEKRVRILQVGNHLPLTLLHSDPVDEDSVFAIESHVHRVLADQHVRGEWFAVHPDVARLAVQLAITHVRTRGLLKTEKIPQSAWTVKAFPVEQRLSVIDEARAEGVSVGTWLTDAVESHAIRGAE